MRKRLSNRKNPEVNKTVYTYKPICFALFRTLVFQALTDAIGPVPLSSAIPSAALHVTKSGEISVVRIDKN